MSIAGYKKGFTLLEILVVISVISIAMSLIAISVTTDDPKRRLRTEAKQFEQVLKLLIDESIFKHKEVGFQIEDKSVSFLQRDPRTGTWNALSSTDDNFFDDYRISAFVDIRLEMEDVEQFLNPQENEVAQKISSIDPLENYEQFEDEEEKIEPDVYIFSSGELTPFDLEFRLEADESFAYVVRANDIGRISCFNLYDEDEAC